MTLFSSVLMFDMNVVDDQHMLIISVYLCLSCHIVCPHFLSKMLFYFFMCFL